MNLEELKNRLETLEVVEAIKKLKARYCQCADERDAAGFANLFTEDGVFEGGTFGRGQGRAGIVTFLRGVQQQSLPFALHYVMNPIIEVQGDTATGQWYLLNQTARDSYTTVTPCAASARRSSVGLTVLNPVNRASRRRQPSL